jgi:hypothetical protein
MVSRIFVIQSEERHVYFFGMCEKIELIFIGVWILGSANMKFKISIHLRLLYDTSLGKNKLTSHSVFLYFKAFYY